MNTNKTYAGISKEFEAKVQQYGNEEGSKTQEENAKRVEEVQGMENRSKFYSHLKRFTPSSR